jgi:hypothetical protein
MATRRTTKLRSLGYLSCLLVLWSYCCAAQTITVRVLDIGSGKPLQKQAVSVSLMYDKGEPLPTDRGPFHLQTDANGEAQFMLPQPLPQHISVQTRLTSEYLRCGCWVLANIPDAIQKGIVGPDPGHPFGTPNVLPSAKPGEIVISARRMSFLERLLYPIVKE